MSLVWYLVVMAGVTYLIRMLPLTLLQKKIRSRAFPLTGVTLQVSESPADIATAVSAGDFFLSYAPLGVD